MQARSWGGSAWSRGITQSCRWGGRARGRAGGRGWVGGGWGWGGGMRRVAEGGGGGVTILPPSLHARTPLPLTHSLTHSLARPQVDTTAPLVAEGDVPPRVELVIVYLRRCEAPPPPLPCCRSLFLSPSFIPFFLSFVWSSSPCSLCCASPLHLHCDPPQPPPPPPPRSYERMGKAAVTCVANCDCGGSEFDGHWEERASLTELHRVWVSQHGECQVRVEVLPDTTSPDGGHKVKLVGERVCGWMWGGGVK